MILITTSTSRAFLANCEKTKAGIDHDPRPVVKLFTPDASATSISPSCSAISASASPDISKTEEARLGRPGERLDAALAGVADEGL